MHSQDSTPLLPRPASTQLAWPVEPGLQEMPELPSPARSLDRLLGALRRGWRLILLAFLVGGALGGLFALAYPPQFTGETVVMAAPRQPDARGLDTTQQPLTLWREPDVDGEIQLMASPEALRRLVAQFRADGRDVVGQPTVLLAARRLLGQLAGAWQNVADLLGLPPVVLPEDQREAWLSALFAWSVDAEPPSDAVIAERIARHLRVSQIGRSTMVKIEYTSPDPVLAADMTNAIAQGYIADRFRRRVESDASAAQWLRERAATLQRNVIDAEQRLADFRTGTLARGRNDLQLTAELETLNREIVQARVQRDQAASRLAAAQERVQRDGPVALLDWDRSPGGGDYVDRLRSTLAEGRQEAVRRGIELGSRHPRVELTEAQVRAVRAQIEAEARARLRSLQTSVDAADRQLRSLEAALQAVRAEINGVQQQQVQLAALEREAEASRAVFEGFVSRQRITEQTGFNEAASWVVSAATPPYRPSAPNMLVVLGAAMLMAMGSGMSAVLYREHRAGRTIRSAEDVWRHLGPVRQLGLIPEVRAAKRRIRKAVKAIARGIEPVLAEALANLQSSLSSAIREEHGRGRVVLVTSALPREGKSSTVAALAAVATAAGQRVVVVDCDLRAPSMHRAFGTRLVPGLAGCLNATADPGSALRLDCKTGVWVLPAGRIVGMPQRALRSQATADLISDLRGRFDLVLLDTPPILSVADARALAPAADAAVLVVRWAKTPGAAARLALQLLADDGIAIAGVALAQVNLDKLTNYEFPEAEPYRKLYRGYCRQPIIPLLPGPSGRESPPQ